MNVVGRLLVKVSSHSGEAGCNNLRIAYRPTSISNSQVIATSMRTHDAMCLIAGRTGTPDGIAFRVYRGDTVIRSKVESPAVRAIVPDVSVFHVAVRSISFPVNCGSLNTDHVSVLFLYCTSEFRRQ